ncbi:MAG: tagatose 1,6-diphosphate aldolase [Rhodospirillales bacterium]|jgi:tagatose 1,6-diphosphate aldolase|nr:tagatose 1,6-diphosphate aldolase [Rhodospirillales bacterium]
MTELSAGKLWGIRRLADANGRFKMTAVDQRPPIKNYVKEQRKVDEASYEDVAAVKIVLTRELAPFSSAMLLDPHVAYPQAVEYVSPAQGLIATLEDSIFEETPRGRLSAEIDNWSVEKIKRSGADAVKVLAWYRPDAAPDICARQQAYVRKIGDECKRFDIPFVFELLVYPLPFEPNQTTDYIEHKGKHPDLVLKSVEVFAAPEFGIDVFKLESPVPAATIADPDKGDANEVTRTQELFDELGRLAGRPWVMLSAGAGMVEFKHVLRYAFNAGASGYLAGRAIWWPAFLKFPDLDAMTAELRASGVPYMAELGRLTDEAATPWFDNSAFGGSADLAGKGARFRNDYASFGE